MALDLAAIAADVATRLGKTDVEVRPAVDAADQYVANDTGVASADLPADDPLLLIGVPLLAMRIFQDSPIPGGNVSEFDPTFADTIVPRHLYRHLDEYWRHLNVNWGIA